jgi:hypothetical protein
VAGWILGIDLPKLPGVNWPTVATATARHAKLRSKGSYSALDAQINVIENARPFGLVLKSGSTAHLAGVPRKKKGWWLESACVFLRQSGGQMTDSAIATELRISPSTLSRSAKWKEERLKYHKAPEKPRKHSDLGPSQDYFGGSYSTPDDPLESDDEDENEEGRETALPKWEKDDSKL